MKAESFAMASSEQSNTKAESFAADTSVQCSTQLAMLYQFNR